MTAGGVQAAPAPRGRRRQLHSPPSPSTGGIISRLASARLRVRWRRALCPPANPHRLIGAGAAQFRQHLRAVYAPHRRCYLAHPITELALAHV